LLLDIGTNRSVELRLAATPAGPKLGFSSMLLEPIRAGLSSKV